MYDRQDERGVPISAGIPPIVIVAVLVGLVVIGVLLTMVAGSSGFGHAWPANTSTQVKLQS